MAQTVAVVKNLLPVYGGYLFNKLKKETVALRAIGKYDQMPTTINLENRKGKCPRCFRVFFLIDNLRLEKHYREDKFYCPGSGASPIGQRRHCPICDLIIKVNQFDDLPLQHTDKDGQHICNGVNRSSI